MLVKEVTRYSPRTVGAIIRKAYDSRRYYCDTERQYVRSRSPYQKVLFRRSILVYVNLHNGKIFERI